MKVSYLGLCDYRSTYHAMKQFTEQRSTETEDELWLLQHHPVYTQGVAGKPEHVFNSGDIPIVATDRGGQITYHGPGQLTGYLLVDIRRLSINARAFVSLIEDTLIDILVHWNISAQTRTDAPGVYFNKENHHLNGAKIAALGLRIKRGCSYHGFNLNIDMNMQPWLGINPCGINTDVTQMVDCIDSPQTLPLEAVVEVATSQFTQRLLALSPV